MKTRVMSALLIILLIMAGAFAACKQEADVEMGSRIFGSPARFRGEVMIDGQSDAEQLVVQAHSSQTNDLLVLENSAGTDVFNVGLDGIIEPSGLDINGNEFILDADADSSLTADTDDQLDLRLAAADEFVFKADELDVTDGQIVNIGAAGTDFSVTGGLTLADALVVSDGDVTASALADGGNEAAVNEFVGVPRMTFVATGTGTNGTTETVAWIDSAPAEWAEVDAGTNVTVTADTDYYKDNTNSVKLEFSDVVDNDGVDGTAPAQDDWSAVDSFGFWIYSTVALTSGDFDLTVDDSDGTDQVYVIGAVTADIWTWIEIDVSGCDSNCDTVDGVFILATSQGGTAHTAADIYIDAAYKWDVADEEALSAAIFDGGAVSGFSIVDANTATHETTVLVEYTDYFTHYESGNDFIVWISDQSANSCTLLIAY